MDINYKAIAQQVSALVEGVPYEVANLANVSALLVCWHIQQIVLPSITVQEKLFDPYDESQVDLSGIVNAR